MGLEPVLMTNKQSNGASDLASKVQHFHHPGTTRSRLPRDSFSCVRPFSKINISYQKSNASKLHYEETRARNNANKNLGPSSNKLNGWVLFGPIGFTTKLTFLCCSDVWQPVIHTAALQDRADASHPGRHTVPSQPVRHGLLATCRSRREQQRTCRRHHRSVQALVQDSSPFII